jgi:hypothetical protein
VTAPSGAAFGGAADTRSGGLTLLLADRYFANLRTHLRYKALVRQMNLPE